MYESNAFLMSIFLSLTNINVKNRKTDVKEVYR